MATAAEWVFGQAIAKAESARQVARAAALATAAPNGFIAPGSLAAFITAMASADSTFITSVNAAASTAGGIGNAPGQAGPAGQAFIPCCWLGSGVYGQGPAPGAGPTSTFANIGV